MDGQFLVTMDVELIAVPPATAKGISLLVEAVIDDLDRTAVDPSVTTRGTGESFTMTIEVVATKMDLGAAFEEAQSAMRAALHAAGVNRATGVATVAENVRILQHA